MNEFIAFWIGIIPGFLWGAYMMWKHMKDKNTIYQTVKMDAKEAADFIESDDAVKQLKKELHL